MTTIFQSFVRWISGLTGWLRYLIIALALHIAILFVLATIKIAVIVVPIAAKFIDPGSVPPVAKAVDDIDPFAPIRDYDYNGPTLGGGGGTPGKGPGGIPTAAGTTPTEYKATIQSADARQDSKTVGEVIGVDTGDAVGVRLQGTPGSVGGPSSGLGEGFGTSGVKGPGGGGFNQRLGPKRAQRGNSLAAERAVLAALRWLKAHQQADGSWESNHPAAIAGLATLAFLGHGHTTDDPEFGETINKAIQYLVRSIGSDDFVQLTMYDHAIVMYALSEGYGMMNQPAALKAPLQRCLATTLKAQHGGWHYLPSQPDADTSVTGWCFQSVEAAKLAGMDIPDSVFTNTANYLWSVYSNGYFLYSPGVRLKVIPTSMTAVGTLCQEFMGNGGDPRIKKALEHLITIPFDWNTAHVWAMYEYYYVTQAMFHAGGAYWEYWNGQFRDKLISVQDPDGHWPFPPNSKESTYESSLAYTTTLGCLMLEVYYRYLPSYLAMEKGQVETKMTPGIGAKLPSMPNLKAPSKP